MKKKGACVSEDVGEKAEKRKMKGVLWVFLMCGGRSEKAAFRFGVVSAFPTHSFRSRNAGWTNGNLEKNKK